MWFLELVGSGIPSAGHRPKEIMSEVDKAKCERLLKAGIAVLTASSI